jgi:hypothetical protein
MTWKHYEINQKYFNLMRSTIIFILDSWLLEHRVWLWLWMWLCDEDNTCTQTHTHTTNSKLILRWFFDFYSFAFLSICASSNLSTKIYERSLIPSEKNLRVLLSWNRSQQMKNFRSRSRVSESKSLTPQLPSHNRCSFIAHKVFTLHRKYPIMFLIRINAPRHAKIFQDNFVFHVDW